MELTKAQQDLLNAWVNTTLANVNSSEMLGRILSHLNEERLGLILRADPAALAFHDAKFYAARERFLEITPDMLNYYIEPASAKTLIDRMLDKNEPREPILERLKGIDPIVALLLRGKLKRTFHETRVEAVRFRMEYFNEILKTISNNPTTMHKGDLSEPSTTHITLTSTIRQQQSALNDNPINEQFLKGPRKL